MRISLRATCLAAVAVALPFGASANEGLLVMQENPAEWVMPTGDYANQRYSSLTRLGGPHKQIG